MNGKGEQSWIEDSIYVGEFKDSKMHGHGVLTKQYGNFRFKVYRGIWVEDTLDGVNFFKPHEV